MRNSSNVTRARTVLTKNGLRVNWRNIGYFTIQKRETDFLVEVKWKYKASIRTETIIVGDEQFKPTNYFKQYNFVPLTEDLFINLNNIMIIEEEPVHGPQEQVIIRVVLIDGFKISVKMTRERWIWWKQNYA